MANEFIRTKPVLISSSLLALTNKHHNANEGDEQGGRKNRNPSEEPRHLEVSTDDCARLRLQLDKGNAPNI